MSSSKKYKKYIVLDSTAFEKLKEAGLVGDYLTPIEKSMISILKNKKLNIDQRLKYYHQLLFQTIRQQQRINESDAPQPSSQATAHTQPAVAPIQVLNNEMQSNESEAKLSSFERKTLSPMQLDDDEEFFETTQTLPRLASAAQAAAVKSNDEIDVAREKEKFLQELRRNSSGTLNLNDLSFKYLDDPSKSYVAVSNEKTGERFSVGKSSNILKRQREQLSQGETPLPKKKRAQAVVKRPAFISPNQNRSGLVRTTQWTPYEKM